MESCRPRILISSADLRMRLRLLHTLHKEFVVQPESDLNHTLRTLRNVEFSCVLVCCRKQSQFASHCQQIFTEIRRVPLMGIVDPYCVMVNPSYFINKYELAGYLGGNASEQVILDFTQQLFSNKKPLIHGEPLQTRIGRILKRLRF